MVGPAAGRVTRSGIRAASERTQEEGHVTPYQQRIANLIVRIQREFMDTDRTLTCAQVQQRVATDEATCTALLDTLVDAGVLTVESGRYMRAVGRSKAA